MNKYKVINPYLAYFSGSPITLPVGTVLEWVEHRQCYIDEVSRVSVGKWAVETWTEFFEVVNEKASPERA